MRLTRPGRSDQVKKYLRQMALTIKEKRRAYGYSQEEMAMDGSALKKLAVDMRSIL